MMHERAGAGEVRFLTMFVTLGNKENSPLKSIRQTGTDSAEVLFRDGRKLDVSVVKNVLKAIIKN